ncbi:hypothetical protein LINPERPRIM_LOCUS16260 [Linum perenne]
MKKEGQRCGSEICSFELALLNSKRIPVMVMDSMGTAGLIIRRNYTNDRGAVKVVAVKFSEEQLSRPIVQNLLKRGKNRVMHVTPEEAKDQRLGKPS